MTQVHEILEKYTWLNDGRKAELKNELLDLFGVSGSLELLQKERERLHTERTVLTPDWMCSKLNNQLHAVWIAEELVKGNNQ